MFVSKHLARNGKFCCVLAGRDSIATGLVCTQTGFVVILVYSKGKLRRYPYCTLTRERCLSNGTATFQVVPSSHDPGFDLAGSLRLCPFIYINTHCPLTFHLSCGRVDLRPLWDVCLVVEHVKFGVDCTNNVLSLKSLKNARI